MAISDYWKLEYNKVGRYWIDDGMGGGNWILTDGDLFSGLAVPKSSAYQIVGAIRNLNELYSFSTLEDLDVNEFIKYKDKYFKISNKRDVVDESEEKFLLYDLESVDYSTVQETNLI